MNRQEVIEQLEAYRVVITNPDDYTTYELKRMLERAKEVNNERI